MIKNYAIIENAKVINIIVSTDDFIQSTGWSFIEFSNEIAVEIGCDVIAGKIIQVKPHPSWILDSNYDWQAPIERPADGKDYSWDESNQVWVLVG